MTGTSEKTIKGIDHRLAAGIFIALVIGIAAGWGRYWYGYFVLGQGTIVGLSIPWTAALFTNSTQEPENNAKPIVRMLVFFICFMVAQAIGFGLAQPWFDPLGWLLRVIDHDTKEAVWGISLLGGAAARSFHLGISGGFWIFLNLFDLFFMCFFLLVGINIQSEKSR